MAARDEPVEVRVPQLGLTGVPLLLSAWYAPRGARVYEGDRLVEIHAGEATVDVPAPATGVLSQRLVHEDDAVEEDQVLGRIEVEDPRPK